VFAGENGGAEMLRSEPWWRGEQDNVNATVDEAFVTVEADEHRVLGDFDTVLERCIAFERVDGGFAFFLENVCNCSEDGVLVGCQGFRCCAGATSAAADEADFESIRVSVPAAKTPLGTARVEAITPPIANEPEVFRNCRRELFWSFDMCFIGVVIRTVIMVGLKSGPRKACRFHELLRWRLSR